MSMLSKRMCWTMGVALLCVGQMAYGGIARPDKGDGARPAQAGETSAVLQKDQSSGSGGDSSRGVAPDWADDFESYPDGSDMHGLGDWQGWDNDPLWGAPLQENIFLSSNSAVEIAGNADLLHLNDQTGGHHSGAWALSAWVYIPDRLMGTQYFLVQKEYTDLAGQDNQWSIQVYIEPNGDVHGDCGADDSCNYTTWEPDTWTEIYANIDLDNDVVNLYFGGFLMGTYTWTEGVFGSDEGCPVEGCIQSYDLFADGASAIYYDDFSLRSKSISIPTVSEWGLIGIGLLTAVVAMIIYGRRRTAVGGAPPAGA